jgi:cytochrome bd ubiquinol oxidase subunit II
VLAVLELGILALSRKGAPEIYEGLTTTLGGHLTVIFTGAVTWGSMLALWKRWYQTARAMAAIQATLIVFGWAISQYPYMIVPDLTIADAAAPDVTLRLLLFCLLVGGMLLFPSLYYLYKLFKPHALSFSSDPEADTTFGSSQTPKKTAR